MERRPFEDHANKRPRVVSPLREQQVWHAAPAVINQKRCAQSMPTCLELDRPAAPSGKLARMHQRQGDPVDSLVQQSREVARDTFAATSCECCGTPYEILERRGSPASTTSRTASTACGLCRRVLSVVAAVVVVQDIRPDG
jgi:hypothetical protein